MDYLEECGISINRNIVECKEKMHKKKEAGSINVLIETLWNVKKNLKQRHDELVTVLIETLWNVKIDAG